MFFYLNYVHTQKINKKKQAHGKAILKDCRQLLALIQQHRGLSTGYLHGGESLLKRISPIEKEIDQIISDMDSKSNWLKENQMWFGIKDHWSRLLKNYTCYGSEHNFRQHCNLIITLLNLIEDCAGQHNLQDLFTKNKKNNDFIWSQLLITVEHIGQVRALGTSIAAAKKASNIQLIQLDYLQTCIHEFLEKPNQPFDNTIIINFLNTFNKEILGTSISMPAETFFNLATSVIDDLLSMSDAYLSEL